MIKSFCSGSVLAMHSSPLLDYEGLVLTYYQMHIGVSSHNCQSWPSGDVTIYGDHYLLYHECFWNYDGENMHNYGTVSNYHLDTKPTCIGMRGLVDRTSFH